MNDEIGPLGATPPDTCPFLVPVTADRLWIYPVSAYCRRLNHRVRVPSATTLARVCTTPDHLECAGYRASAQTLTKKADTPAIPPASVW